MSKQTEYTVLTKFRNKEKALFLIRELEKRGKTCYNFFNLPKNANFFEKNSPEEYMRKMENTSEFWKNSYFASVFKKDLQGLKNAEKVIVLLPAGNSVHIEAGIAYGFGKKLILVGEISKPETLYLIFDEHFKTITDFLKSLDRNN
jgi:hypothetical protein